MKKRELYLGVALLCLLCNEFFAQRTTIGYWKKEVTIIETYFLLNGVVPQFNASNLSCWDASRVMDTTMSNPAGVIGNPERLFVVAVTEEISKGLRNHMLVLARGKAGTALPKNRDEHGFYMGSSGFDILASLYVDPVKMKSPVYFHYLSALNSLIKAGAAFKSENEMMTSLNENYWYEGITNVYFEKADLAANVCDTIPLRSIMPHAGILPEINGVLDLTDLSREDYFADMLRIYSKDGAERVAIHFISGASGLGYYETFSKESHPEMIFDKKDISRFGTPQIHGKKI